MIWYATHGDQVHYHTAYLVDHSQSKSDPPTHETVSVISDLSEPNKFYALCEHRDGIP